MNLLKTRRTMEETGEPVSASVYLIDTKKENSSREFTSTLYKKDGNTDNCDVFVSKNIKIDPIS